MPRITVTVDDRHLKFIEDHTEYDSRSEAVREIINEYEDLRKNVNNYESRIEELEKNHTETPIQKK